MAWQDTITTITRVLINDIESPYKNSNDKLRQFILVAAYYVFQEIDFSTDYVVDLTTGISPDPSLNGDQTVVNFIAMKTACLVDQGSFRDKAALDGLEARCEMASLKVSGHAEGFKVLLALGPCSAYEQLKKDYQFGDETIVHGIFSPFISDTFDPMNIYTGRSGDYR